MILLISPFNQQNNGKKNRYIKIFYLLIENVCIIMLVQETTVLLFNFQANF